MKQYWEESGGIRFVFNLLVVTQRSISSNAFILAIYIYQTIQHDWNVGVKEDKRQVRETRGL